jgi:hypothetical protein
LKFLRSDDGAAARDRVEVGASPNAWRIGGSR